MPRQPNAFHCEGGEFVAALVEGHLSWPSAVVALVRLGFGSSQPISVSAACTHVAHRLWVCIRDVEQYRFIAIFRCRSISEAFPLYYHVHSKVRVGVERGSVLYLVANQHPLKAAGERVDQGLVLVDLRARSMTQSCVPRVCVRCASAGSPRCQKLRPQKTLSRGYKTRRWDDSGQVGVLPSRRQWHLVPIEFFAGPLRNLSSPSSRSGHPYPAGVSSRGAVQEMRRTCHTVRDLPVSPICIRLCWSLWFHVLAALQQSTALRYPAVLV